MKIFGKNSIQNYNPLSFYSKQKKRRPKTGLAPGSIIHTGKVHMDTMRIEVFDYTSDAFEECEVKEIEELERYKRESSVTWINVVGLHDVEKIARLGELFHLHSLTLEDIADTHQRPKTEEYDTYLYLTLMMINYDHKLKKIDLEQVSIIIHQNYIISFQEKEGDVFHDVRKRLRNTTGKARKRGADYLAYMLVDVIIDYYFETMDEVWNRIERMEEIVIRHPEHIELRDIQLLRKDLIHLRKYIFPVRDAIHELSLRYENFFSESTMVYLRDSHDHVMQVVESLDTYRETLNSTMDIYLSQLSIKMNQVMKVLTIIATIFIPLTFIAGVYGMNFEHMPELSKDWAYPEGFYVLIGMVTFVMVLYMKSKRWL